MAEPDRGDRPDRYARQRLFPPLSGESQRRLAEARVTLIGCGALGSAIADTLARAGVGFLRLVDRDFLELNNLQRQVLFDEDDLAAGLPKAAAAATKLARINSSVICEPVVADCNASSIDAMLDGAHLVLDGTDNFETRFLINDAAVKRGLPWVYGACVAATGMIMPVVPGRTPCLRCVWPEPPPPGSSPTCDTAGIIAPVVHIVAALQCVEAIKLLTGRDGDLCRGLIQIDAWKGVFDVFELRDARDPRCVCCGQRRFDFLVSDQSGAAALCGRNAVQVRPHRADAIDFDLLAERLAGVVEAAPTRNRFMLRFRVSRYDVTVFRDGRAIIQGTDDPDEARSVYAKYIGN